MHMTSLHWACKMGRTDMAQMLWIVFMRCALWCSDLAVEVLSYGSRELVRVLLLK